MAIADDDKRFAKAVTAALAQPEGTGTKNASWLGQHFSKDNALAQVSRLVD